MPNPPFITFGAGGMGENHSNTVHVDNLGSDPVASISDLDSSSHRWLNLLRYHHRCEVGGCEN